MDVLVKERFEDNKAGITPDDIPKVFDPFFTTKEIGKGTGLEMNIAYNIIEDHGGPLPLKVNSAKAPHLS